MTCVFEELVLIEQDIQIQISHKPGADEEFPQNIITAEDKKWSSVTTQSE